MFDIGFTLTDNFDGIQSLDRNYEKMELKTCDFFPKNYDVLLEHENDIWTCWEEAAKLYYAKAKLKVLATYNWHTSEQGKWLKEIALVEEYFSKILNQTNSLFPENPETQYLLIIGNFIEEKLSWQYCSFDYLGIKKDPKSTV